METTKMELVEMEVTEWKRLPPPKRSGSRRDYNHDLLNVLERNVIANSYYGVAMEFKNAEYDTRNARANTMRNIGRYITREPTKGYTLNIPIRNERSAPPFMNPQNAGKTVFQYHPKTDEYVLLGRVKPEKVNFMRRRLDDLLADFALAVFDQYDPIYKGVIPERDAKIAELRKAIEKFRGRFGFNDTTIQFIAEVAEVSGHFFDVKGCEFNEGYFGGKNAVELIYLLTDPLSYLQKHKWMPVLDNFYPFGGEVLEKLSWYKNGRIRSEEKIWNDLQSYGDYKDMAIFCEETNIEEEAAVEKLQPPKKEDAPASESTTDSENKSMDEAATTTTMEKDTDTNSDNSEVNSEELAEQPNPEAAPETTSEASSVNLDDHQDTQIPVVEGEGLAELPQQPQAEPNQQNKDMMVHLDGWMATQMLTLEDYYNQTEPTQEELQSNMEDLMELDEYSDGEFEDVDLS